MLIRLILWVSIIWLAPFLYVTMRNEAKFKKNIAVGVTLPAEAREDAEVLSLLEEYKKNESIVCWGLLALGVVFFFVFPNFKGMMNSWCLWTDLCIVLPYFPVVRSNKKLKAVKKQRGWENRGSAELMVDTSAILPEKWISPWVFVLSALACLLPLLWNRQLWGLYLTFFGSNVVAGLGYRYLYRGKVDVVDENTALSQALARVRKYNWSKMWVTLAVSTGVISLLTGLVWGKPGLYFLLIMAWAAYITVVCVKIELRVRRVQEKLTEDCGAGEYVDDDAHWIWGFLYCNPNDSRAMVANRIGTGNCMNLARPIGKFMAVLLVIMMVGLPFTGNLVGLIGTGPIGLELTEDALVVEYGKKPYVKVYTKDIQSAELLQKLPEGLSRTWGTGADELLKGNFTAEGLGALNLCLDPNCPPYILISKKSGNKLLLGTRSAEETLAVWAQICAEVHQEE